MFLVRIAEQVQRSCNIPGLRVSVVNTFGRVDEIRRDGKHFPDMVHTNLPPPGVVAC